MNSWSVPSAPPPLPHDRRRRRRGQPALAANMAGRWDSLLLRCFRTGHQLPNGWAALEHAPAPSGCAWSGPSVLPGAASTTSSCPAGAGSLIYAGFFSLGIWFPPAPTKRPRGGPWATIASWANFLAAPGQNEWYAGGFDSSLSLCFSDPWQMPPMAPGGFPFGAAFLVLL